MQKSWLQDLLSSCFLASRLVMRKVGVYYISTNQRSTEKKIGNKNRNRKQLPGNACFLLFLFLDFRVNREDEDKPREPLNPVHYSELSVEKQQEPHLVLLLSSSSLISLTAYQICSGFMRGHTVQMFYYFTTWWINASTFARMCRKEKKLVRQALENIVHKSLKAKKKSIFYTESYCSATAFFFFFFLRHMWKSNSLKMVTQAHSHRKRITVLEHF